MILYALSRNTGDIVWTATLDTQPLLSIDSSPVLAGNTIVIGVASFEQGIKKPDYTFRGSIVGLDADTGQTRWRVYTTQNDATAGAGRSVWSSAAVDEARKLVFIGTGQTYEQPASPRGDSLIAIHYKTGKVAWVHQFTAGDVFTVAGGGPGPDADVGASPNLFSIRGREVVGVGQKNGVYHVLDRQTGETVWEVQLTRGSPLGGIMVTAAVDDGVIYVNSNKWRAFGIFSGVNSPLDTSSTFALDARDGTILWEKAMPAPMFGAVTLLGLPSTLRFQNQSVRMIVHTSLGGDDVRVKLTNGCGAARLVIGAATVGIRNTGARVLPGTQHPLRFAGQTAISIPGGSTVTSDPVGLTLPPLSDLTITLYLPTLTVPRTSHPQAATGYLSGPGNFTNDVDSAAFPTIVRQWFFLDAVDVRTSRDAGAIVAFGDSIIDGAGSTYDANTRWPDFLARRLG